jgi:8-oxo-dGTP diphosphatase
MDCLLREVWEEFGLRLPPDRLIWSRTFPSMTDPALAGWFFAGPLAADEVAAIRFGDEGQRWQMMPLDLWLARPDAVGPLQARTALVLSEISPSEMTLD